MFSLVYSSRITSNTGCTYYILTIVNSYYCQIAIQTNKIHTNAGEQKSDTQILPSCAMRLEQFVFKLIVLLFSVIIYEYSCFAVALIRVVRTKVEIVDVILKIWFNEITYGALLSKTDRRNRSNIAKYIKNAICSATVHERPRSINLLLTSCPHPLSEVNDHSISMVHPWPT